MSDTTKLTKNQAVVADTLRNAGRPMSAYQILDEKRVRDNGLKAPLTIYRALEKLMDAGIVHRIESLNAFVACTGDKPHADPAAFMICHDCKQTIEFPAHELHQQASKRAADFGFRMDGMHLEISGSCADCIAAAQA